MKIFSYGKDGGQESTVHGYWLCEFKSLFSIALLCFDGNSREAYHNHAFNCISWILSGQLKETMLDGSVNTYRAGLKPILTYRDTHHKVDSTGKTWVLTFRGPWSKTWNEYFPSTGEHVTLTHGRKIYENTNKNNT